MSPKPGDVLMGDFTIVSPVEAERRQATRTPAQRELHDRLVGGFAALAQEMREAHAERG